MTIFFDIALLANFVSTYELIDLVDYELTKINANKEESVRPIQH
jgi:hypothetical protein